MYYRDDMRCQIDGRHCLVVHYECKLRDKEWIIDENDDDYFEEIKYKCIRCGEYFESYEVTMLYRIEDSKLIGIFVCDECKEEKENGGMEEH